MKSDINSIKLDIDLLRSDVSTPQRTQFLSERNSCALFSKSNRPLGQATLVRLPKHGVVVAAARHSVHEKEDVIHTTANLYCPSIFSDRAFEVTSWTPHKTLDIGLFRLVDQQLQRDGNGAPISNVKLHSDIIGTAFMFETLGGSRPVQEILKTFSLRGHVFSVHRSFATASIASAPGFSGCGLYSAENLVAIITSTGRYVLSPPASGSVLPPSTDFQSTHSSLELNAKECYMKGNKTDACWNQITAWIQLESRIPMTNILSADKLEEILAE
eukprot:c1891_g1_i1.p1 GENE.c1891_g1_i1~~c1891_g1_i1.p1  ORF type:complete len:272 (+),score=46.34 c1891_g1_i1:2-817(+)